MRLGKLNGRQLTPIEALEAASGKLTLLGKLLPKLRSEGHKVLIFSQFKIMLDIVEEYLDLLELPLERIDGDTKGETSPVLRARATNCIGAVIGQASPAPVIACTKSTAVPAMLCKT